MAEFGMAARPDTEKPVSTYAPLREKTLAPHRLSALPSVQGREAVNQHLVLAVHASLAPVEAEWTAFQQHAHTTFYQTFLWCRAWYETVGKAEGIEIRIVTATNQRGDTVFILPLQIRRRWGARILEWLGTPHTTYGHGLFSPAHLPLARDWLSRNWAGVAKLAGPIDAIFMANMPETLSGKPHPFQQLFTMRGANRCYRTALESNYEAFLTKKRSKETRRYYRKKERAFTAQGNLTFGVPETREEMHATLTTMFEQQEKRLGECGIHGVFGPVEREFIHRLADIQDETNPVFLPYRLQFNGKTLAVLLGGVQGNTFWAMISSLAETELRKYSPGDLALRRTIEASCKQGLARFDFAAGDTAYKLHWADEVVQFHELLTAVSLRGLPWVCFQGAATIAKRRIKQSPAIRNGAMALRKALLGTHLRHVPPQD